MARRAFMKSFCPTFYKKRVAPATHEGTVNSFPTGLKKKFVFLANFYKVLVESWPAEAGSGGRSGNCGH